MIFWKTESFKALQKAWYQRLKDEGFRDAEEIVGDDLRLKDMQSPLPRAPQDGRDAYYQFISHRVQQTIFMRDVDRLILCMHADGHRIKTICEELAKRGQKRCRHTVRYRIRVYEMHWGIKAYTPKQLNRKAG